jgi:hypothetical protein
MTEAEREKVERELILDILIESTKWHIDNDADDAIRLEVCLRAKRLLGIEEIPGESQSVVERGLARQQQSKNKNLHVGQVRVCINGKPKWFPKDMCVQVPFAKSKNGLRWTLKSEVPDGQA